MFGNMHQQAAESRGKPLSSNETRRFEIRTCKVPDPLVGAVDAAAKVPQQQMRQRTALRFPPQVSQLSLAQIAFVSVGQQTVHTPRDVPQLKCNRGQPNWSRIHFNASQVTAPALCILPSEFQRMQNRPDYRWNIGECGS
jgi:hypothetical protein